MEQWTSEDPGKAERWAPGPAGRWQGPYIVQGLLGSLEPRSPTGAKWYSPWGRGPYHVTRARPPSCSAVLVFRAQRLTGGVAFASAASRIFVRLLALSRRPSPPPPAELALSPLADMADIKNNPEYSSFFGVMGASSAMVFSGEHRSRRTRGCRSYAGL